MQLAIIGENVPMRNSVLNAILLRVNHRYDKVLYVGNFPDCISSIEDIFESNVLTVISDPSYLTDKVIARMRYQSINFILSCNVIIDTEISMLISTWILHESERMIARICHLANISRPVINWHHNSYLIYFNERFIASNSIPTIINMLFPIKSCPIS